MGNPLAIDSGYDSAYGMPQMKQEHGHFLGCFFSGEDVHEPQAWPLRPLSPWPVVEQSHIQGRNRGTQDKNDGSVHGANIHLCCCDC